MSFNDDLASDLSEVFFSDFQHVATIGGQSVVGFFSRSNSSYMDASVPFFEAPGNVLALVRSGDVIAIDGVQYGVISRDYPAGMIRLNLGVV